VGGALPRIMNSAIVAYKYDPEKGELERVGDETFIDIFGSDS